MLEFSLEKECLAEGYTAVCGVDEAGRGPLAGPVVAAAVILPIDAVIEGLNDSKKLTAKQRERLYDEICKTASAWSVAYATEKEIDEINILQATFLAMKRAVAGLKVIPDFVLVDGNRLPTWDFAAKAIVKGDGKSPSIAAASVLAKVTRDRIMEALAQEFPQYEFEKHKGYPTKLHYQKIKEYGISQVHRLSFLKNLDEHDD